jgi:hypothetical protein
MCKQVTVCPGHIWTTLFFAVVYYIVESHMYATNNKNIFVSFYGNVKRTSQSVYICA